MWCEILHRGSIDVEEELLRLQGLRRSWERPVETVMTFLSFFSKLLYNWFKLRFDAEKNQFVAILQT